MANYHLCRLGLFILCPFLKGLSRADGTHVFSTSGENVRLPCNNALSDCTSTTWNYNRDSSQTVELIAKGIKKNDIERRERLSVGSNCSLNIKNVTQEDYGLYTCRRYVNGQQQGTDAPVHLHFLHVSSASSSQSEIGSGRSVTLSCQLYSSGISCDTLVRSEGIQLMWVNQANVSVMTDSRYQILFSSTHCTSTLTTRPLNEDHNREWRCQLTQNNRLKTSATITVKDSELNSTSSTQSPSTYKPASYTTEIVMSALAAALALVLVAVVWVIYKKRSNNKRETYSSVVKDVNEHKETYETINMSIPSTPNANADDVTYSEVTSSSKKQVQMDNDHSNDTVTYAAIR